MELAERGPHGVFYLAVGWAWACDPLNQGRDQSTLGHVHDINDSTETARVEQRPHHPTPEPDRPIDNDF